jgi:amino acid permease
MVEKVGEVADFQSGSMTRTINKEEHQISLPIAIFSVVSVTVGAGMVSVPKSSYESGIPWAIGYNIFNFVACVYSIHLYYMCATVTKKWSIPHLGFECFGYCSLYFVNFVTFLAFGMLPIAYYIIFANLAKSLFKEIPYVKEHPDFFLATQWFNVLILAVLIFPLIIKKKIQELKIAGILLFSGVILFILLMFILKIASGEKLSYTAGESEVFYKFSFDKEFVSSLSTAFVAYGFQSAFFPIYNSLKVKSYKTGMSFTFLGIGFCFIIYMCVMFVSLYSFGTHIKGDVLLNVEDVTEWESYILRVIFLLVISTHTPFIFFIGKEAVLSFVALIYIRKRNTPEEHMEQFNYQDTSNEPLMKSMENKESRKMHQTLDFRRQTMRNIGVSQMQVSSSVDYNISMALPFYTKSMKTMVIDSQIDDGDLMPAHDVLPNVWYYIIT